MFNFILGSDSFVLALLIEDLYFSSQLLARGNPCESPREVGALLEAPATIGKNKKVTGQNPSGAR